MSQESAHVRCLLRQISTDFFDRNISKLTLETHHMSQKRTYVRALLRQYFLSLSKKLYPECIQAKKPQQLLI